MKLGRIRREYESKRTRQKNEDGYLDDVILLPALIALTVKLIPEKVWDKNRIQAENMWKDGKPKKWYYAIPIVLAWGLLVWIVVKLIWFR